MGNLKDDIQSKYFAMVRELETKGFNHDIARDVAYNELLEVL